MARRGGSSGSRWGVLFFPRVLVHLIHLEGLSYHRLCGGAVVDIGLDALTEGMHGVAQHMQVAGEAGGRFARADAPQQQHYGGRPLTTVCKDRPTEEGIVAITRAAAVGVIKTLAAKLTAGSPAAARTDEPVGVQMPLQPQAIVKEIHDGKINHTASHNGRCGTPTGHEPYVCDLH